jgi:hypothetical protein
MLQPAIYQSIHPSIVNTKAERKDIKQKPPTHQNLRNASHSACEQILCDLHARILYALKICHCFLFFFFFFLLFLLFFFSFFCCFSSNPSMPRP